MHLLFTPRLSVSTSVGVKSAYSPAPSTVYSQPPPPQRQVTALKPLAPSSSVSTSYNIYPASTSVQQPPTPISSYTLGSSFSSTVAATSYSGKMQYDDRMRSCMICSTLDQIILDSAAVTVHWLCLLISTIGLDTLWDISVCAW